MISIKTKEETNSLKYLEQVIVSFLSNHVHFYVSESVHVMLADVCLVSGYLSVFTSLVI